MTHSLTASLYDNSCDNPLIAEHPSKEGPIKAKLQIASLFKRMDKPDLAFISRCLSLIEGRLSIIPPDNAGTPPRLLPGSSHTGGISTSRVLIELPDVSSLTKMRIPPCLASIADNQPKLRLTQHQTNFGTFVYLVLIREVTWECSIEPKELTFFCMHHQKLRSNGISI